ncbi:hypothetical protein Q4I30_006369 [Leishmania utingensis]|uniref:Uncharacterized protein n=1 Tax=Leishmania utingensis TaxID=653362 RepID=A0AAW3A434_9TRYP
MGRRHKKHLGPSSVSVQPLSFTEVCEAAPLCTSATSGSVPQAPASFHQYHAQKSEESEEIRLHSLIQGQPLPGISPLASPYPTACHPRSPRRDSLTASMTQFAAFTPACVSLSNRSARPSLRHVPRNRSGSLPDVSLWSITSFLQCPPIGNESSASFLSCIAAAPASQRTSFSSSDSLAAQRRARNDASPVALGNPSVMRHLTKKRERRMSKGSKNEWSSSAVNRSTAMPSQ